MGKIEDLANNYGRYIALPWQRDLAGPQRTIFIVHDKTDERKIRAKIDLFEIASEESGHAWKLHDFTDCFARWMTQSDYRESYFQEPSDLRLKLESHFTPFAASELREVLTSADVDENTVVAVHGVASLYGFTKVSLVLQEAERDIRGRLVLFFPGEYDNNCYRLLDVRDGWSYLAVPITLHEGMGTE